MGRDTLPGGGVNTMKDVQNKKMRPLRIPLPGGKVLHLGPQKVAQIADNALEHPGVQRLIKDGTIEILGDGERAGGGDDGGSGPGPSQGQGKSPFRRGHGER